MTDPNSCPFCSRSVVLIDGGLAVAVSDGFPVSRGHSLIIPRRHEPDFFALTDEEREAVFRVLGRLKDMLQVKYSPDGFNVGVNVGKAAGQTVGHAHLHLIPRYVGDVQDPRGGVRWVVPDKAAYWQK